MQAGKGNKLARQRHHLYNLNFNLIYYFFEDLLKAFRIYVLWSTQNKNKRPSEPRGLNVVVENGDGDREIDRRDNSVALGFAK